MLPNKAHHLQLAALHAMDFAGFLFGNVNEDGELEDEGVLDKVILM